MTIQRSALITQKLNLLLMVSPPFRVFFLAQCCKSQGEETDAAVALIEQVGSWLVTYYWSSRLVNYFVRPFSAMRVYPARFSTKLAFGL
jgi:hypothetical protein